MQTTSLKSSYRGFTIVELLVVVVVIVLLATIAVLSYNGVTASAHDRAIQADLRNLGSKVSEYQVRYGKTPLATGSDTPFASMDIKVSRDSYGSHFMANGTGNSLIYCSNGTDYAFIAGSKSGKVFYFKDDGVKEGSQALITYVSLCESYGIPSPPSGTYVPVWFYASNEWRPWL